MPFVNAYHRLSKRKAVRKRIVAVFDFGFSDCMKAARGPWPHLPLLNGSGTRPIAQVTAGLALITDRHRFRAAPTPTLYWLPNSHDRELHRQSALIDEYARALRTMIASRGLRISPTLFLEALSSFDSAVKTYWSVTSMHQSLAGAVDLVVQSEPANQQSGEICLSISEAMQQESF